MAEKTKLVSFKQKTIMEPPDLLELQKDSFRWFMQEGLAEELRMISPIRGYEGKLELSFSGKFVLGKPKYSTRDCLIRETTYALPLKVEARLLNKKTKEIKNAIIKKRNMIDLFGFSKMYFVNANNKPDKIPKPVTRYVAFFSEVSRRFPSSDTISSTNFSA